MHWQSESSAQLRLCPGVEFTTCKAPAEGWFTLKEGMSFALPEKQV